MLAGHPIPRSVWSPFVYLWQDVLVALVLGVVARFARRPAIVWSLYAIVAAHVAINVPIARELSSPLTLTMMRGAGGALADSIGHYLTPANLALIALMVMTATLAPWLIARVNISIGIGRTRLAVAGALVWVLIGAMATPQLDTVGRHRNAIATLLPRTAPDAGSGPASSDWRASPFPAAAPRAADDLTRVHASARDSNVLLIALESTAARYLKIYGADRDPMPNLTRLANRGLVVDDAYAVYPESIKGLFSTLCSRFPAYDTPAEIYAEVPCTSIAQRLETAGYRTALFHSGRFDYLGMRAVIEQRGFDVLEDAGAIGGNVNSSFGIDEASSVRRILQWLDTLGTDERFFATYLPIAGHHPYATVAPGPFNDGTELGQYFNALHEGDAALGELVAGLVARQLDRNTVIVIFGDHGEAFLQHDGNVAHTQFIYDENMRVPFVIALPAGDKGAPGPTRVNRVLSLIDTAPTILDVLGLAPVAEHQGVSVFSREPRMALFFTDYSLGWLGLRDGCWKYMLQLDAGRSSLFDVCADPGESINRARDDEGRVRAYRERVEQWSAAQRQAIAARR